MPIIYALHGYMGSGKTTYAKKICDESKALLMSHDAWMVSLYGKNPPPEMFRVYFDRIEKHILKTAEQLLNMNVNIVLDWGFWSREDRDKIRQWTRKLPNAELRMIALTAPKDTLKQRVLKRTEQDLDDQLVIDENAFEVLFKKFEAIQDDEELYQTINTV